MIYVHVDDMDDLVSLRQAFVGMEEWAIDKVIKRRMRRILATSTFCIISKNPVDVTTDARVELKEGDCDGEMRWTRSEETVSRGFQLCDIKDIVFYMRDGKEIERSGKDKKLPSAHFQAAGKVIPELERWDVSHHITTSSRKKVE